VRTLLFAIALTLTINPASAQVADPTDQVRAAIVDMNKAAAKLDAATAVLLKNTENRPTRQIVAQSLAAMVSDAANGAVQDSRRLRQGKPAADGVGPRLLNNHLISRANVLAAQLAKRTSGPRLRVAPLRAVFL